MSSGRRCEVDNDTFCGPTAYSERCGSVAQRSCTKICVLLVSVFLGG